MRACALMTDGHMEKRIAEGRGRRGWRRIWRALNLCRYFVSLGAGGGYNDVILWFFFYIPFCDLAAHRKYTENNAHRSKVYSSASFFWLYFIFNGYNNLHIKNWSLLGSFNTHTQGITQKFTWDHLKKLFSLPIFGWVGWGWEKSLTLIL